MDPVRKFRVTNNIVSGSYDQFFEIKSVISSKVNLPFSQDTYRVIMFDGLRIQLINESTEDIVEGILS